MQYEFVGRTIINASGRFLSYATCDAADTGADPRVEVIINGRSRAVIPLGAQLRFEERVERIEIAPVDPAIQVSGTVLVGDDLVVLPIVGGVVEVIDSSIRQTLAGKQFATGLERQAGGAAYAVIGLVATGTRRIVVRRVMYGQTSNGAIRSWYATGIPGAPLASRSPQNKLLAQPASLHCQIMVLPDTTVAAGTDPDSDPVNLSAWKQFVIHRALASATVEMPLTSPLIIEPGQGIYFVSQNIGQLLNVNFDLEEIAS